jgi:hypothetical protein
VTDIVSIPRTDIVHTEFLTQTESVVRAVKESKDFGTGFQFLRLMKEMKKTLDDGTGLVLNGMAEIWEPANHDGETFESAVVREVGLELVTIQRHLKIQRVLPLIPEEYREDVSLMPFRSKIQIAGLVEGGYDMDKSDWNAIVRQPSDKDVAKIARQIKGVEPRSNWYELTIDSNGVVMCHSIRGHFEVGRLNVYDDNPDVQKGISRLTSCTNVQPAREY